MSTMKITLYLFSLLMLFAFNGCTYKSNTYYQVGEKNIKLITQKKYLIIWSTAFRDNQKDISQRLSYIKDGLKEKFRAYDNIDIAHDNNILLETDVDIFNKSKMQNYDETIILRFEEIGPNIKLYLSPILWSTENTIILRYKVYNINNMKIKTNTSYSQFRGGPFTLHSAEELPIDIKNALDEIFVLEKG